MERAAKNAGRDASPDFKMGVTAMANATSYFVTYPLDYLKTRKQLQQAPKLSYFVYRPPRELWCGASVATLGIVAKGFARFFAFENASKLVGMDSRRFSVSRAIVAGALAGFFESTFIVTPFEAAKTAYIEHASRTPSSTGSLVSFLRTMKPQDFCKGLTATFVRSCTVSTFRFASYTGLRQTIDGNLPPGELLGPVEIFTISSIAAAITVFLTQPIDVVKTQMQRLDSRKLYRSTWHCARKLLHESPAFLYAGALPRLLRLVVTTGLSGFAFESAFRMDRARHSTSAFS